MLLFLSAALLAVGSTQAQSNVPAYVSPDGLVGWWPFTGNAADSSGKANHGTVTNAQLTTDRRGFEKSAYDFDGNGDYINVLDNPTLRCRQVTMAAWVYQRNTNPAQENQVIYKGKFADATSEAYSLNMRLETSVKINSGCQSGQGWQNLSFDRQVALNTWTHLCATFDGDSIHAYINGVQVKSSAVSGKIDSCIGADLRFGYNHNIYQSGNAFLGKIDDIGIWNRALSAAEVKVLYTEVPIPSGMELVATPGSFSLYPNPAHDKFRLTCKGPSAGGLFKATVTDLTGCVVLQETFAGAQKELTLSGRLSSGVYLATVTDAKGALLLREKLVVE